MDEFETLRLHVRPPCAADIDAIVRLLDDFEVTRMTGRIPHPYARQHAIDWLAWLSKSGERAYLGLERGNLVGCVGLNPSDDGRAAELGYWIGKPYWGRGLATELARGIIVHGFGRLGFQRLVARHMLANPASARVLSKCGFVHTGRGLCHSIASGEEAEALEYELTHREAEAQPWFGPS